MQPTYCRIGDCSNRVLARGLCSKHYQRAAKRGGDPLGELQVRRALIKESCTRDGCVEPQYRRKGLCESHFRLLQGDKVEARNKPSRAAGRKRARRGEAQAFLKANLYVLSDGCKIWPYGTGNGGYGTVRINGKTYGVHVLACEAFCGPMPEPGMEAAHTCRTRLCWAGEHVVWKSHKDNEADKLRDRTVACGEIHGGARLADQDVLAIRAAYIRGGVTQDVLASTYNVTQGTIHLIVARKTWTHLPE